MGDCFPPFSCARCARALCTTHRLEQSEINTSWSFIFILMFSMPESPKMLAQIAGLLTRKSCRLRPAFSKAQFSHCLSMMNCTQATHLSPLHLASFAGHCQLQPAHFWHKPGAKRSAVVGAAAACLLRLRRAACTSLTKTCLPGTATFPCAALSSQHRRIKCHFHNSHGRTRVGLRFPAAQPTVSAGSANFRQSRSQSGPVSIDRCSLVGLPESTPMIAYVHG